MKSPIRMLAAGLAVLVAASLAVADTTVGQTFPKLADFGLNGHLPDQTGRVVLVDFWATWCAPCRSSLPAYNALQRELGDRGLVIIGVSVDQNDDHYTQFVDKLSPDFATVRDATHRCVAAVHPAAMPTCYLLDRHGVVRAVHAGFRGDTTIRALREEIVRLLEEKS